MDTLFVTDQQIRIYDRLLLVVGNHGVGKTKLLEAIANHECQWESQYDYTIVSLLLTSSLDTSQTIIDKVLVENSQDAYVSYMKRNFKEDAAHTILSRLPNVEALLSQDTLYYLAFRRWVLIRMLLDIDDQKKMVVVLDEPELFAHPLLVREICVLLRKLQEKGHIIIVATNSETVVSRLFIDIEQIVRLEDKKDVIQVHADQLIKNIQTFYYQDTYLLRRFSQASQQDVGLNNVVNKYIRIYLSSVFSKQIFNLIHSDCVILGEGSSEDVLFDYIDQVLHPEWMREYRVHYMGCLGKSTMPFYFLFLNHLGIKTVCLFDADKSTNPVHVAYASAFQKYENENKGVFASMLLEPDLENVLQIVPSYKLLAMEKPINIYQHTFATNDIYDKVCEMADLIKLLFEGMKKG